MYSPSSAPLLYAAVCNYTVPLSHLHPQIIQGNTESGVPSNSSGGYLRRVIYSLGYIRAILEPCSEGSPGCLYHMRVPTLEPRWTCGCYGIVAIEATMVEYQNAMLASLSSYRRCTIRSIRSDINWQKLFSVLFRVLCLFPKFKGLISRMIYYIWTMHPVNLLRQALQRYARVEDIMSDARCLAYNILANKVSPKLVS